jgi:hypothetical protein
MNFIAALVVSSLINLQQPNHVPKTEHTVETTKLEQIATDFLKIRFSDADFIQTTVVEKNNGQDVVVYLAFSADSTPVNTCMVSLHRHNQNKTHVEQFSCVNYQKKIGFRENINSTVYH